MELVEQTTSENVQTNDDGSVEWYMKWNWRIESVTKKKGWAYAIFALKSGNDEIRSERRKKERKKRTDKNDYECFFVIKMNGERIDSRFFVKKRWRLFLIWCIHFKMAPVPGQQYGVVDKWCGEQTTTKRDICRNWQQMCEKEERKTSAYKEVHWNVRQYNQTLFASQFDWLQKCKFDRPIESDSFRKWIRKIMQSDGRKWKKKVRIIRMAIMCCHSNKEKKTNFHLIKVLSSPKERN